MSCHFSCYVRHSLYLFNYIVLDAHELFAYCLIINRVKHERRQESLTQNSQLPRDIVRQQLDIPLNLLLKYFSGYLLQFDYFNPTNQIYIKILWYLYSRAYIGNCISYAYYNIYMHSYQYSMRLNNK